MIAAKPRTHALLLLLGAAHLLATASLTPHGHFSVDECTYHLATRGVAEGGLSVWNGYAERPSEELVWPTTAVLDGALAPVTPPFHAVLAWPAYAALGFAGLFWLNAVAFLLLLWLTHRHARALFDDPWLAGVAVAVLALATYAWEYSQGAWPHTLASLCVMGALTCVGRALDTRTAAPGRWALAAGLVLGLGVGVRLDVAIAAPALLLALLFAGPGRRWLAAPCAAGALPPLLVLALANYSKFGIASPFTYGPNRSPSGDWTAYLPVAGLGLALAASAWAGSGPLRGRLRARAPAVWLAAAAALALLLGVDALRELVVRLAGGVFTLLVDLRTLREDIVRPGLSRSDGGGLVYAGHLKKAWLQSLPYLAGVLVLAGVAAVRRPALRAHLLGLLLVPACYLAAFGAFRWDGGLAFNLRYLTPALPVVAIVTAWALRELGAREHRLALAVGAGLAALLYAALARTHGHTPDAMERFVLDAPLWLAAAGGLLAIARCTRHHARLDAAARAAMAAGLVWAGLVAFHYDYPAARWLRGYNAELSRATREVVRDDAILFTTHPDPFCGLLDADRVRIALPRRDAYADFRPLVDLHLAAGRGVYAALPPPAWARLERSGRLTGLRVEALHEHPVFVIGRLRP